MTKRSVEYNRWQCERKRRRNMDIVISEKEKRGCLLCGIRDHRVLTFHHRDPNVKSFKISVGIIRKKGISALLQEMDKCDILCANCHMKQHILNEYSTTKYIADKQKILCDIKEQSGCAHCGITDHRILVFHHINHKDKGFGLDIASIKSKNTDSILAEVDKCQVLCHNCHNRLHWNMSHMSENEFITTYGEGLE